MCVCVCACVCVCRLLQLLNEVQVRVSIGGFQSRLPFVDLLRSQVRARFAHLECHFNLFRTVCVATNGVLLIYLVVSSALERYSYWYSSFLATIMVDHFLLFAQ